MKCGQCKRQLTAAEPVFRLFIDLRVNWQMVCSSCEAAASKACVFAPLWDLLRCCSQCSRPVYMDSPPRKAIHFVCSPACRQAAHKASYRCTHPRSPVVERQCICGAAFRPKQRNEAKFCSAACKQRAYRARLTIPTATPASPSPALARHRLDIAGAVNVPLIGSDHHRSSVRTLHEKPSPFSAPTPGDGFLSSRRGTTRQASGMDGITIALSSRRSQATSHAV